MLIHLANGEQVRGDLIKFAALRSDMAPVPVTLECDIRAGDESLEKLLAEGKLLSLSNGDKFRILKSVRTSERAMQGARIMAGVRLTAVLDACAEVTMVRRSALIKEDAPLSAIYRAAGASLRAVDADFPVPRFCCPVGGTPTFQIAQALQDEGGIVRWRGGKMQFIRLPDLFTGKPLMKLPDNASDNVQSGFEERHTIPWFMSLDEAGAGVFGNREKARVARYVPFANAQRLRNMTRCLVRRKQAKIGIDTRICAGDLIEFSSGLKLTVMTAAHVFQSGTDDGGQQGAYTKLWLGSMEE